MTTLELLYHMWGLVSTIIDRKLLGKVTFDYMVEKWWLKDIFHKSSDPIKSGGYFHDMFP